MSTSAKKGVIIDSETIENRIIETENLRDEIQGYIDDICEVSGAGDYCDIEEGNERKECCEKLALLFTDIDALTDNISSRSDEFYSQKISEILKERDEIIDYYNL